MELVAGLQRPRHRALLPGRRGVRRAARAAAVAQRTWRQGHSQQGPGTALLGAIADCGAEADEVNAFPVKDKITKKIKVGKTGGKSIWYLVMQILVYF